MKKVIFFMTALAAVITLFSVMVHKSAEAAGCYYTEHGDYICDNFVPVTTPPPPPPGREEEPDVVPDPNAEPGPAPPVGGGWSEERSRAAVCISQNDNATGGYCAKGTANILTAMGYPVTRGDAHNWDETLPANGWTRTSASPQNCPPGGVLVFDRNNPPGRGGGAKYGHVEIVTETPEGGRRYVSDAARRNAGGTVPNNYRGCYVYPRQTTPTGAYAQCMRGVQ